MRSRREFLQLAAITTALIGSKSLSSVAANQSLTSDHLLDFDSKGQISILHITDLHGQLKTCLLQTSVRKLWCWEL